MSPQFCKPDPCMQLNNGSDVDHFLLKAIDLDFVVKASFIQKAPSQPQLALNFG